MATTESSAGRRGNVLEVQDHPHACLSGYVYLGYTYVGEDGGEYEAFEALPCRRCAEEASL